MNFLGISSVALLRLEWVTAVMTIRSLFYVLVLNKDFSVKLDKNGPYLVPILTKSPYFFKTLTEEKGFLKTFLPIQ